MDLEMQRPFLNCALTASLLFTLTFAPGCGAEDAKQSIQNTDDVSARAPDGAGDDSQGSVCAAGDPCDDDLEGDGVSNAQDNCPDVFNPSQMDGDHEMSLHITDDSEFWKACVCCGLPAVFHA